MISSSKHDHTKKGSQQTKDPIAFSSNINKNDEELNTRGTKRGMPDHERTPTPSKRMNLSDYDSESIESEDEIHIKDQVKVLIKRVSALEKELKIMKQPLKSSSEDQKDGPYQVMEMDQFLLLKERVEHQAFPFSCVADVEAFNYLVKTSIGVKDYIN